MVVVVIMFWRMLGFWGNASDNLFLKESTYVLMGTPENEGLVDIGGFMKKSLESSNPFFFVSVQLVKIEI
jgi:hypothetical protein